MIRLTNREAPNLPYIPGSVRVTWLRSVYRLVRVPQCVVPDPGSLSELVRCLVPQDDEATPSGCLARVISPAQVEVIGLVFGSSPFSVLGELGQKTALADSLSPINFW